MVSPCCDWVLMTNQTFAAAAAAAVADDAKCGVDCVAAAAVAVVVVVAGGAGGGDDATREDHRVDLVIPILEVVDPVAPGAGAMALLPHPPLHWALSCNSSMTSPT